MERLVERILEWLYTAIAAGERLTGEILDAVEEAKDDPCVPWHEQFLTSLARCTVVPLAILAISSMNIIFILPGLFLAITIAFPAAHDVCSLLLRYGSDIRSDSGGYQPFDDDPEEVDPLQF